MTRGEDQAQEIVADVVVESGVEIRRRQLLLELELPPELLMLALEQLVAAKAVDRAVFRGGHEPGSGIVRNPGLGPALEGGDKRVLRELLGNADVAHDPGETRDEPRRLDAPNGVDRAMGIGSCHCCRYIISHRSVQAVASAN